MPRREGTASTAITHPEILRDSIESVVPPNVEIKGGSLSFDLPAGKVLSSTTWRDIVTAGPTTVTLSVDAASLQLSFSPAILIKPVLLANIEWSGVTYSFEKGSMSIALSGGRTSPEGTARQQINDFFAGLISGTPIAAGYDPLKDPDVAGTLAKIKANFDSAPSSGGNVGPADASNLVGRINLQLQKPIQKSASSGSVTISGAVSIAVAARGTGATFDPKAPVVDHFTVSGDSIVVQKDGADVAQLQSLTVVNGGAVTINYLKLLGQAKELAQTEAGVKALLLFGLLGLGSPSDRLAVSSATPDLQAELVPGLTRGMIQDSLTQAFREFVLENAHVLPGYDLTTIFGVAPPQPAQ